MMHRLVVGGLLPLGVLADPVPLADTGFSVERSGNYTDLEHAAYGSLSEQLPGQLLLTRFGAAPFFGKSQVTLVDLAEGNHVDVATNIDWPNVATVVEEKVFGFKAALIGAGFLVPSHTTGGIWVVELEKEAKVLTSGAVKITKDKKGYLPDSGWFYHQADLADMNGDGLLDIVTSRCAYSVEPWNKKEGELVWLEQPKTGALNGTAWVEHFIQKGPDFLFTLAPKATGPEIQACAAEYIGERLTLVHGSESKGYKTRVLDSDLGHGFGCSWVDLNGDGKLDLLATNHLNQNGSVFGYSWDGDISSEATKIQKYVLATGFSAVTKMAGTAAPGDAIPFFPKKGAETGKPMILVSGDNGNSFYVLVPEAQADASNWKYTKQLIDFVGADVGRIAVGDTDGDGLAEFFVPAYDAGEVIHYKIKERNTTADVIVV
eukprot:TRINITY_DN9586_c0_g1_i1.p1 TRINITY_DN9586_c0_g1~~TRINITY_DN9586_c0_g1_i1.p1  ORF type:complete len:432 (+),score=104.15 TRINITY_DN9586_c0_g1_i1:75-1370(+)